MAGKSRHPSRSRASAAYDGDYDPAQFIVPASDSKGHSDRATFRLSVAMAREIQIIVASRLFPFLDASDLYRWCVQEGLRVLNRMEEIPRSVHGQAEAAAEIAREVLFDKQYEHVFAEMDQAMASLHQRGALDEMKQFYARVHSQFDKMPPGYHRTRYLGELARRWEHIVAPRKAAARKAAAQERGVAAGGEETGT